MFALAPRADPDPRGLRDHLPDPRRGVALLDRDLVDPVFDDRVRAPPQPDAPADRRRRLRSPPPRRAAGLPPLLRPDAAAEPGRTGVSSAAGCPTRGRCRSRRSRQPSPAVPRSWTSDARPSSPPSTCPGRSRSRPARRSGRGSAGSSSTTGRWSSSCPTWPIGTTRSGRRCGSATTPSPVTFGAGSGPGSRPAARSRAAVVSRSSELADRLGDGDELEPLVIDVRQPGEYEAGHVEGALHIAAGDLEARLGRAAPQPPDRDDVRLRLPVQRRRLAAQAGRLRRRLVGRRWRAGLGGGGPARRARNGLREPLSLGPP